MQSLNSALFLGAMTPARFLGGRYFSQDGRAAVFQITMPVIGDRSNEVLDLVWSLEQVDDVTLLAELLAG